VYSIPAFNRRSETIGFQERLLPGFWSAAAYFEFRAGFRYDAEQVSLDKYTIVEKHKTWEVYNWLQYFSPESLEKELIENGLVVETVLGDVAGHPYDSAGTEFAVVAKRP
jgi:hypothetical protein